ncbi:MAG: ATP-binding cassette domain-containing protein [Bacteroidales bacterium]|nr:ATP-binding cassette domain-containing protein [Bacteroidales bacterium]
MAILTANKVTKRFGDFTALNGVSLEVNDQAIFGLLGPNGAGKTTLIRIINQITGPDEGEVFYSGHKLHPDDIAEIGYLPEERGLYKKMGVGEQAIYLAQLKGLSRNDAVKRLKYWFEKFEIQAWWNKKVEELSKGMQQKVQFIVTVVHEPKLLIFDEPFSGFDPINVNLLRDEILELRRKGSTIIFSTHNMASVEELCDDIVLINKSNKILDGNVKEIRRQHFNDTYRIHYRNPTQELKPLLMPGFELLEASQSDGLHEALIKIPKGTDSGVLLGKLLPHLQIAYFSEVIPSMNDIFISEVNAENAVNANSILES